MLTNSGSGVPSFPSVRIQPGEVTSPTRKLCTATSVPTWDSLIPSPGYTDLAEGSDASAQGYYIPVKRNNSPGIAIHAAVAHGTDADGTWGIVYIIGLRERTIPVGNARLIAYNAVPIGILAVQGGSRDVADVDTIRPIGSQPTSFKWADHMEFAANELFVPSEAVNIIKVADGEAECQIHTQGVAAVILAPVANEGTAGSAGTACTGLALCHSQI